VDNSDDKKNQPTESKQNGRLKFFPNCPVDKLTPYQRNPRRNEDAIKTVAKSLEKYGFNAPIILDPDYVICVGHTRFKAAQQLGLDTVPVLVVDDLTGDRFKGYNIADNQTGTISDWDIPNLWLELQELEAAGMPAADMGFTKEEIDKLLAGAGILDEDDLPPMGSGEEEGPEYQTMTFTLRHEQALIVREALAASKEKGEFDGPNKNPNGNALTRICEAYK